MRSSGKFSAETVATLSRRSAMLCSNPDCGALTTGPASQADASVNIGEAAHIYGRTNTSARFKAGLTETELCDITNGVWLCRNCHKLVDNDGLRFPADLLFAWRRQHEAAVLARIGKSGDVLREKINQEHLKQFADTSYLAQQIIIDRPRLWEYKLAVEIFRSEFRPVHARWQQLQRGLYSRRSAIIPLGEFSDWMSAKFAESSRAIAALTPLGHDLMASFGPLGVPGDERAIVDTTRLIVAAARNLLEWEEDLRFTHVPNEFHDALVAIRGFAGMQLDELLRIPDGLSKILDEENPAGERKINLVFTVPDGSVEAFGAAMERATQELLAKG
ncbi:MAG: hypothetical protein QOF14_5811 [Hyphomicrobiales bacterium]|nr:hypothetical protein [Hyphomicrobiales bacterium]